MAETTNVHVAGSDRLRVGLIGAGGRGRGAAKDCVNAAEGVEIVAIGEAFQDRLDEAKRVLAESLGDKCKVTDERCFVGFDAYQKVIASGVDLVILATPPGFRPRHIQAAVEAGKHVFAEKPCAVDPAGVRIVLEAAKTIERKQLGFVAGTQRRHMPSYIETIGRVHDGAIGTIAGGSCYWLQSGLWSKPRQPGWSDLEWQLRNWLYFTWLSGDHIVEQHVHNIDVMNWVLGGPPVSAYGMGGRQSRTDPAYGHIYDHFGVEYTYPTGVRIVSLCRQNDNTDGRVTETIVGAEGVAEPRRGRIKGKNPFRYEGDQKMSVGMHNEHADLIAGIRSGQPLNEAKRIAETTLTAIMGRMTAYSGKEVTWEQAMKSSEDLFPKTLDFKQSYPVPPVAMPGKMPLV